MFTRKSLDQSVWVILPLFSVLFSSRFLHLIFHLGLCAYRWYLISLNPEKTDPKQAIEWEKEEERSAVKAVKTSCAYKTQFRGGEKSVKLPLEHPYHNTPTSTPSPPTTTLKHVWGHISTLHSSHLLAIHFAVVVFKTLQRSAAFGKLHNFCDRLNLPSTLKSLPVTKTRAGKRQKYIFHWP